MKQKLLKVIQLLREIDDEMENIICINASVLDEDFGEEFTFWGIADMIEEFMNREENKNGN